LARLSDDTHDSTKVKLKAKLGEEIRELLSTAAYLALFLCAFAAYRSLITSEITDQTVYVRFGVSIVTALVVAKFILVGDALHLGQRRVRPTRLITRTLQKAILYSLLVFVFAVLEKIVEGLIHRETVGYTLDRLIHLGRDEIGARTLVIFVALIPFFAFRELAHMAGSDDTFKLVFQRQRTDNLA